jgi:hypothetical protein
MATFLAFSCVMCEVCVGGVGEEVEKWCGEKASKTAHQGRRIWRGMLQRAQPPGAWIARVGLLDLLVT